MSRVFFSLVFWVSHFQFLHKTISCLSLNNPHLKKAIFVRGLPEMNVKNIVMENLIIQSNKGLDMTEGSDIVLKNVSLITKDINPVMNIHNSRNIILNKISYANADLLLNVSGEKSSGIAVTSTDVSKAKKGLEVSYGAKESAVKIVPL